MLLHWVRHRRSIRTKSTQRWTRWCYSNNPWANLTTILAQISDVVSLGIGIDSKLTRSVPLLRSLHWPPVKVRILFKISLLTYKTLHEKQPVYLYFMLAPSLPSTFTEISQAKKLVWHSLGSRPTQTQGLFTLVPRLSGTACSCLSVQPLQLLPSRNIWRHISLYQPMPTLESSICWHFSFRNLFASWE